MSRWVAATLIASACVNAGAAGVYRCGPDRNVYSETPCADGASVEVDDPRTATQRADSRAAVERERKLAADLAREREKSARASRPTTAAALGSASSADPAAAKRPAPRASGAASAAPRDFIAIVPGSAGKSRSASAPSR